MAGQTQIGAIHVEASIGTAKYVSGARKVRAETAALEGDIKRRFSGMGARVKGGIAGIVGALSIGALVQVGRAALKYASDLGDVSQQLGVTTRDLQTFRFAAGQLGVEQDELETGLRNLNKTLGQVAVGAEKPAKALRAIGLNAQEVSRMDTGDAFRAIADALSRVENRAQRAAVEVALFGENGQKLDTMLAGGSKPLNELADAADRLGIVLSDEQIQKADETADKLDAMKKVLTARIAGVVADNADAIVTLADALSELVVVLAQVVGWLAKAGNALANFAANAPDWAARIGILANPLLGFAPIIGAIAGGGSSSVTMKLPPARPVGGRIVDPFLEKPPRTPRPRRTRTPRDDSARDLFRFEQDELRAQMDILRAKQQLAGDYVERTTLGVQILDLERQSYQNDLQFQVSQKDLTKAQADRLMLLYDQKDSLERQKLMQDEQEERQREVTQLREVDFDIQREAVETQLQLAETAKERRAIELRLLDLVYRQERARLEAVLADEQSSYVAKEEARRRLAALNANFAADRQGVMNRTRGPMEEWAAQFRDIGEELEDLKVRGIMGAVDALTQLTQGFASFRDAAIQAIQSVLQELIRLQLMKLAVSLFAGPSGSTAGVAASATAIGNFGLPGFAAGGSFDILGRRGIDKNVLSLNGLPIAKVSFGERLSIGNDNQSMRGGDNFSFVFPGVTNAREARQSGLQAAHAFRRAVAQSAKVNG